MKEPSTEFERGVRDFMKVVKGHVHDIESIGNFKGFCLEFLMRWLYDINQTLI